MPATGAEQPIKNAGKTSLGHATLRFMHFVLELVPPDAPDKIQTLLSQLLLDLPEADDDRVIDEPNHCETAAELFTLLFGFIHAPPRFESRVYRSSR